MANKQHYPSHAAKQTATVDLEAAVKAAKAEMDTLEGRVPASLVESSGKGGKLQSVDLEATKAEQKQAERVAKWTAMDRAAMLPDNVGASFQKCEVRDRVQLTSKT